MKTTVLPMTCLKLHMEGALFAPVQVAANVWELQSETRVLAGATGKPFHFANEAAAEVWVKSNLIRASKRALNRQQELDRLMTRNLQSPRDYLDEEIATMQSFTNGDWNVFLQGDTLAADWEVINAGVSLDAQNALSVGSDGGVFYNAPEPQAAQGGGGVQVVEFVINGNVSEATYSLEHLKGEMPHLYELSYVVTTAHAGIKLGMSTQKLRNNKIFAMADADKVYICKTDYDNAQFTNGVSGGLTQLPIDYVDIVLRAVWVG